MLGAVLVMVGLGCAWTVGRVGPLLAQGRADVANTMAFRAFTALLPGVRDGEALPTTTIPNLEALGFTLRGIEVERHSPASLVFQYRDGQGARATVSVTMAEGAVSTDAPDALSWRTAGKTISVAGPLPAARLALVADVVRDAIR